MKEQIYLVLLWWWNSLDCLLYDWPLLLWELHLPSTRSVQWKKVIYHLNIECKQKRLVDWEDISIKLLEKRSLYSRYFLKKLSTSIIKRIRLIFSYFVFKSLFLSYIHRYTISTIQPQFNYQWFIHPSISNSSIYRSIQESIHPSIRPSVQPHVSFLLNK